MNRFHCYLLFNLNSSYIRSVARRWLLFIFFVLVIIYVCILYDIHSVMECKMLQYDNKRYSTTANGTA